VVAGSGHPRLILAIYLPLIVLATLGASWGMDNLTHVTNDRGALRAAWSDAHTWLVSLLYVGTFGSFIGFSFAFGQVLQIQFKTQFDTPVKAAYLTFLGPVLGSLARPLGRRLADRFGGPTVTATAFVAMAGATGVVLAASAQASLALFVAGFVALFILSGAGNGSTYKMIPAIFDARARRQEAAGEDPAEASRQARRSTRALIGVAGAVGAAGAVGVNLVFRQSFLSTHSGDAAYLAFLAFYLVCLAVTLGVYSRGRRSLSPV
jgi:MFS transporter, NNP family, nitrate/nitrite transporter